jgi:hypothetical protein
MRCSGPVAGVEQKRPYFLHSGHGIQFTPQTSKPLSEMPLPADACNEPEEALQQALTLWEKRGRRRLGILAAAGLFEASLARGERRTVTTREESDQLVSDITRRGMAQPARQVKRVQEIS